MFDLEKINEVIRENPVVLFDALQLDFEIKNDRVCTRCVVHFGDNDHALNINLRNASWRCYTGECHKVFHGSLIGFVRGVLSNKKLGWRSRGDEIYPFGKTIQYIKSIYDIKKCGIDKNSKDNREWSNQVVQVKKIEKDYICTRDYYLNQVKIPSEYFASRAFDTEVLKEFDVGSCCRPDSYLGGRSLVPTFDLAGRKVLGISGRAETKELEPRWKNTTNFPASQTLYNIWKASPFIKKARTVIITEGQADVWRLWEAGHYNCVSLYGGDLSPSKHFQLDQLGVMNIILIMDNDENKAGDKHAQNILSQYSRLYNIRKLTLPNDAKDLADMSTFQVKEFLKGKI